MRTTVLFWLSVLATFLAGVGCKDGGEDMSKSSAEKECDVRGTVVAVDHAKPAVTLDHEEIPGLMKAMQMQFGVADAKLLESIKTGDQVQGRLKKSESGYVITRLAKR